MAEANIEPVGRSKIDEYGLAEKVLELRGDGGLSLEDTAEVINAYHLPANAELINRMTIMRWEKRNNIVYKQRDQVAMGVPTSAWTEIQQLQGRSYKHMQRINKKLDTVLRAVDDDLPAKLEDPASKKKLGDSLSEIASLSNAYTNALKAHQGIVDQRVKYEKEMLRAEQVKKVVNLLLKTLNKYPEVKAAFMAEFRESEEFEIMNAL